MRTALLPIIVSLAGLAGCTRSLPTALPRASAASLEAAEALPARIGRAIEEEPPLPGETRDGWEALDRGAAPAGSSGHHGHHGHTGHGAHREAADPRATEGTVMRSEATLGPLAAAILVSGCVPSFRADLDGIEALTSHALPRDLVDAVDPVVDAQIERVLREPMTADAAVRVALASNRELRASLRDLGVERGLLLQAGLLPNPEFELDLRRQDDREQPLQVELYVEYEITHALLTPLRVAAASADLEAARYRAAGRVLETAYEARAAFYAALAAEQQLGVALRALEGARRVPRGRADALRGGQPARARSGHADRGLRGGPRDHRHARAPSAPRRASGSRASSACTAGTPSTSSRASSRRRPTRTRCRPRSSATRSRPAWSWPRCAAASPPSPTASV
ncbi:MAG: hypothetical protein M5U28_04050 [Sandaracinaceae bacterium]|nr:hypothetical protein [Sandaracinaceae bacterium]